MSSRKVTERKRALARAQKRNILLREGDPTRTTEQQLAESRVSTKERRYQEREMAKKLAAAKKQARVNKGGMYKGKKHTYATGGMTKKTKAKRSK